MEGFSSRESVVIDMKIAGKEKYLILRTDALQEVIFNEDPKFLPNILLRLPSCL